MHAHVAVARRRSRRCTPSGRITAAYCSRHVPAARNRRAQPPQVGKELYFVGLIDILCEYGLKKQLEHHYKAAKHGERVGAQNFSVVDPVQYSTRFQNFVADALD